MLKVSLVTGVLFTLLAEGCMLSPTYITEQVASDASVIDTSAIEVDWAYDCVCNG